MPDLGANGDVVGQTAKRHAVIEAVDHEVARVLQAAQNAGYSVVLTTDHRNHEELVDSFTGAVHTQHTTYPVLSLVIDETKRLLSGN